MSSSIVVFPISVSHYRVISFRETTILKTMTVLTNLKFETMRSSILSSSMVAYASVLSVKISIYGISIFTVIFTRFDSKEFVLPGPITGFTVLKRIIKRFCKLKAYALK